MSDHSGGCARSRRLLRSAGLGAIAAVACAAVCGAAATGAFAAAATTLPASALGTIVPTGGPLPPPGTPGTRISAKCPQWLFSDPAGFTFTSGSAVLYRPDNSGVPGMFGLPPFDGANVQGTAVLADVADSTQGTYTGKAHFWYGLNYNANGQFYLGETIMFSGSGPAGSISLHANPGFVTSASGHNSGWGQLTLRCA